MIKTNSPYYISVPWSGYDSYNLQIYVWSGLQSNKPTEPQYTVSNINPLGISANSEVNISTFINDFIGFNLPTSNVTALLSGGNVVWVSVDVKYPLTSSSNILEDTAIRGYSYGIEGKNAPFLNQTYYEQKVSENGTYVFSFIGNTLDINGISYTNGNPLEANEICQVAIIKPSEFTEDVITITDGVTPLASLIKTKEHKYKPIDIVFINKNGMLQSITFFKEKIETLKIENESYENNFGQPINGEHQFKNYNVNGRSSFSVNSGFVSEDNNEIFKQLFLSEKVWQLTGTTYIPLNLESKDLEYKTRLKERLINYKLSFAYSYNEINNI